MGRKVKTQQRRKNFCRGNKKTQIFPDPYRADFPFAFGELFLSVEDENKKKKRECMGVNRES